MTDIKKSDVFGPKQSPSFALSMNTEQCRYCYNAFNDYDANQERIAELEYAIQRISSMEEDEGRFDSDDALAEAFNICREVK